ncbi:hypothetical protein ACIQVE_22485 [Pseudomonas sp. NPDC098747]|uniref:hypothetical protein n=1 Tax=Pseudomonas sp. NPDC098747 TaxID=3364487 RepID=UPI00383B8830
MPGRISIKEVIEFFKWFVGQLTWKLIAQLSVAFLLTGIFYIVWDKRGTLVSIALSQWGYPEIDKERLPEFVDGLSKELNPATIFLWSVNVSNNTRRAVYVWANGVRRQELEGRVEMLFPDDIQGVNNVVRLIRGEQFCDEIKAWSPHITLLKESGVMWGCAVAIPPEISRLIGAVTIGFSESRVEEFPKIRTSIIRWSQYLIGEAL